MELILIILKNYLICGNNKNIDRKSIFCIDGDSN